MFHRETRSVWGERIAKMVLVGDSLLMTHDTYKLVLSDCVARLWLDYVSCL